MNVYIIMERDNAQYQLVRKLISDNPQFKKGFTFEEIIKLTPLSWNDRKILKEMFGGSYSKVLTPSIHFEYENNKWEVDEIDIQRGVHQRITQVLNHALDQGEYLLGFPVSTKDIKLNTFLIKQDNWFWEKVNKEFEKNFPDPEPSEAEEFEDKNTPVNQESLKFLSNGLQEKLGEVSCFDYEFVKAFLEVLGDYEKEILIPRLFEEK